MTLNFLYIQGHRARIRAESSWI